MPKNELLIFSSKCLYILGFYSTALNSSCYFKFSFPIESLGATHFSKLFLVYFGLMEVLIELRLSVAPFTHSRGVYGTAVSTSH